MANVRPLFPPSVKTELVAEREQLAERASHMYTLTHSAAWDVYRAVLSEIENQMIQSLITCEPGQHDYIRGYILGMRNAWSMPDYLIAKSQGKES